MPVPFGTADDCLFEFGRLQAGETALIHAGASGVGIAAIQLAKRAGRTVLATASSAERLERLGDSASTTASTTPPRDFVERVRRLTDGRGPMSSSTRSAGPTCRGACSAWPTGDGASPSATPGGRPPSTLDISTMRANNQTLVGYFLGAELFLGTRAHAMIAGHLDDIAAGRLRVVIDRRFPLEQAGEAHAYIESRQAFGRVLLVP